MARKSRLPSARPAAGLIAQRYQKLADLGGGGMAYVSAVLDLTTGKRLALKRPTEQRSPEQQSRINDMFAREYHALCQLAHPRIVEVYDYGVDEHGPYYTMEALDGGDLQQLVPLDYPRLCEIARDVCAALSLIHSRRIVHRDLGPRNIRCTTNGIAKLIDFGAITPMGPSKELVGTPAYCAPEVLHMQALDARTDLYALGATLYYALTGHHPYPARDFASLPNAWRFALARPSELAEHVPEALDALIMDLLQLDPSLRPNNAAEVMERLLAIEGRPANDRAPDQLMVAQAYLTTPAFVGRSAELPRVRSRILRGLRKHGTVLLVTSEPGAGRSRFLEACLLEAKIHGYTCLRADADDSASGDYGALQRLLLQLQQILPELANVILTPELPTLGRVAPQLLKGATIDLATFDHPDRLRSAVQESARRVLLAAAERIPLVIAIDDLHRCDEPSAATLALLSRDIESARIVILATALESELERNNATFSVLFANAGNVALPKLTAAQSEELLASIFGTSPELAPLAQRLHALSTGSPRDLMRLAQHLVDRGLARYADGSWSLPPHLDANDLPVSVSQLFVERVWRLRPEARLLASAIALCPDLSFSFDEARKLSEQTQAAAFMQDVDTLTQADILRLRTGRLMLADRTWASPLKLGLSDEVQRGLHLRLAALFEARGDDPFRHAQQRLRAGDVNRALDIFVAFAIESRKQTDTNPEAFRALLRALPSDWFDTLVEAMQLCEQRGRPRRDRFAIAARIGGIGALAGVTDRVHVPAWLMELKEASGLAHYEAADPTLDPGVRLKAALEAAGARYQALPEHERSVDPGQAIALLSMGARFVMQSAAPAHDLTLLRHLPSLQPYVPLAPGLAVIETLRIGVVARVSGRLDLALQTYSKLLDIVSAPGGGGLDPTHLTYTRLLLMNAAGFMEAGLGIGKCLERADILEADPMFRVNASIVRMQHALWQGDQLSAERERKQFEERRIQSSYNLADHTHLMWQALAYAAMEDLTRLKHTLMEIGPLAEKYAGWRAVELYARAEHQRLRGDYAGALTVLEPTLEGIDAGESCVWAPLAAAHVRTLAGYGHLDQALELGERYAQAARAAELGMTAEDTIALALEVARAKHGDKQVGPRIEAAIEHATRIGASGIPLGLAYEARAYIAVFQSDKPAYKHWSALAEEELTRHKNSALAARLQRLKREAQRKQLVSLPPLQPRAAPGGIGLTLLKSRLSKCALASERAKAMLQTLAQRAGATRGFLYFTSPTGPMFASSLLEEAPEPVLSAMVHDYLLAETEAREQNTGDEGQNSVLESQWTAFGDAHYRHVLLSHQSDAGHFVTGAAIFIVAAGQLFNHPSETAAQVSRLAQEHGDAVAVRVQEDDEED